MAFNAVHTVLHLQQVSPPRICLSVMQCLHTSCCLLCCIFGLSGLMQTGKKETSQLRRQAGCIIHLSTHLCTDPQQHTLVIVQAALCQHEFMQGLTLSKAVQSRRSGSRASTEKMLLQLAPEPTAAFRSKVVVPPKGGASEDALLGAAVQSQHFLLPTTHQLMSEWLSCVMHGAVPAAITHGAQLHQYS